MIRLQFVPPGSEQICYAFYKHMCILWDKEEKCIVLCVSRCIICVTPIFVDCVKYCPWLLWNYTLEEVIHIYFAHVFIFLCFVHFHLLYIINRLKFLCNVAILLTACFDYCVTLQNTNCELQEAIIARIEIISCIPKSANFALKMIRRLIIRASCLDVDTLDWGSN